LKAHVKLHHGIQLNAIESLRGVAALMVVVYHLAELVKLPLPQALGFVPTYFGLGVPLFYTLSGFVLAFGYADRLDSRSQVMSFYVRRLFRIMPLFYTMLALWLVANWVVWHKTLPLQTIFLNLSFLYGLVPGQHESIVWAGWSIGIEMLFYLVFPVIAVLIHNTRSALIGFVVACVVSGATQGALQAAQMGSYAYMNLITQLPFFMAGLAAYRIWQRTGFLRHRAGWLLLAVAVVTAGLLVTQWFYVLLVQKVSASAPMHLWAMVFALLVLSTCMASNPILERGPLRHLGQISFSFYLLHPMLLVGLIKLDFVARVGAVTPHVGLAFALGSAIAVALIWAASSVSFRLIELPGIALGRKLAAKVATTRT